MIAKLETEAPPEALISAFESTNEIVRAAQVKGGSTAIVAYFVGSLLYIANAGDCRAVLCQGNKV